MSEGLLLWAGSMCQSTNIIMSRKHVVQGATLKFKLGRKSYGMVGRALFFRLCLCLSMFSLIKYVLPLEA